MQCENKIHLGLRPGATDRYVIWRAEHGIVGFEMGNPRCARS